MKRIAFHPAARAELLEAAERYEEQASDLGAQFIDEVEHAVRFVEEHPGLGISIGEAGRLRRWTLRRIPLLCNLSHRGRDAVHSCDSTSAKEARILEESRLAQCASGADASCGG